MKCSDCGFENRDGVKFCENCGTPLARTCAQCGAALTSQAKFCGNCGAPTSPQTSKGDEGEVKVRLAALQQSAPTALQEKIRTPSSQLEGERKSVTILFTDIVGSTALAEKLDPEEWSETFRRERDSTTFGTSVCLCLFVSRRGGGPTC